MADFDLEFQSLDDGADALESVLGATQAAGEVFRSELEDMRATLAESSRYVDGLSR